LRVFFFRMEFVVAGPILDSLGDLHRAPPQMDFLEFVSPEGLVYDMLQIYSINLDS
jgi:hypothetical protein